MKIWITGSSGMLGQDLAQVLTTAGHFCLGTDREVDITDLQSVQNFLAQNSPEFVVNCAAYTAVDKAESEEELAFAVNAIGPGNLAQATAEKGIGLIHISTDYVLNGAPPHALSEMEAMAPQSAYGRTKAKGEIRVQVANPKHWIIRTAWLYGIRGNNFVKTMLRLMKEKESLKVVDDQWGSPTWSMDLSRAILNVITSGKNPGVYHYSNQGEITWCTFAKEIQRQAISLGLLQREIPIQGISSSEYPSPTKRPNWSVLDKTAIQSAFHVQVPLWSDSLQQYLILEKSLGA